MENSKWIDKKSLRQFLRQKMKVRREEDVERAAQEQLLLTKHLIDFFKRREGVWAAFQPLNDEPSPLESVSACTHIQWVFPLIEGDDISFWLPNPKSGFRLGAFGIQEPDPKHSQSIALKDIQGFLVPGLGFDHFGSRIGRGKGFYDRALKKSPGEKVGVAFSEQVLAEKLPCDPWDVLMDVLVTEREVKHFRVQG